MRISDWSSDVCSSDLLINVTAQHREITSDTRRAGIGNGFTVPAHVPGEANGSCNFAVRTGRELPKKNLPTAHLIGAFAFQAARNIVGTGRQIGRAHV